MEVNLIGDKTLNIATFLITFSGIFLFFSSIIKPKLIITVNLQEKDFKNMKKYIKYTRFIYFIGGLTMIILPLLELFCLIDKTSYGLYLIITALLLSLSDHCIKELFILSKD